MGTHAFWSLLVRQVTDVRIYQPIISFARCKAGVICG
jgi:hypothetical protein